jgi:hypothetical protein
MKHRRTVVVVVVVAAVKLMQVLNGYYVKGWWLLMFPALKTMKQTTSYMTTCNPNNMWNVKDEWKKKKENTKTQLQQTKNMALSSNQNHFRTAHVHVSDLHGQWQVWSDLEHTFTVSLVTISIATDHIRTYLKCTHFFTVIKNVCIGTQHFVSWTCHWSGTKSVQWW